MKEELRESGFGMVNRHTPIKTWNKLEPKYHVKATKVNEQPGLH